MEKENKASDEIIKKVTEAIGKTFEENQKKPFQYVVAYYLTKNDKLLGYHGDSFCTLVQDKAEGKRYNGENPYSQLAIVRKNLDSTLLAEEVPEGTQGISATFKALHNSIRKTYYNGLTKDDIYIMAEYLDDGIPPQRFVYQVINNENS